MGEHGKRIRAPQGTVVGPDGNLYLPDGSPVTDAMLQEMQGLAEGAAAINPAALFPGYTVPEGHVEGGLQSTNPAPEKQGGYWSEAAGGLNPLNMLGGSHLGAATAGLTPTRDMRQQAEADEDMWKNLLVPGVAGYNAMKRLGGSIRGPEITEERRILEAALSEAKRERKMKRRGISNPRDGDGDGMVNDGTPEEKAAGYWSELAGGLNPLNIYGGSPIGAAAALATPTRNLQDQALADQDMWKNLLIPGVGPYNTMKRLGGAIRGPEITEERRELAAERAEGKKKKRDGDGDGMVNDGTPEEKEAGFLRSQLESIDLGHRLAYYAVHGVEKVAKKKKKKRKSRKVLIGPGGKASYRRGEEEEKQAADPSADHVGRGKMLSRGMNRKLDKGKGVSMKRVNKRENRQFPDRAPLPTNPNKVPPGYKAAAIKQAAGGLQGVYGPQPTHDQYGRPAGTPPGAHGDANSDGVPDDRQPRGTTAGPPPRGGSHNPANQKFNMSGSPYGPNYNPNAAPPITKGTPSSANSPLRGSKTAPSKKSYTPKVNKDPGLQGVYGKAPKETRAAAVVSLRDIISRGTATYLGR